MLTEKSQRVLPASEVGNQQATEKISCKVADLYQRVRSSPTFNRIMAPPVLGCLVGMLVGMVPRAQEALLSEDAPLSPLKYALECLGEGYMAASILVLAGSLAKSRASGAASSDDAQPNSVFYRKVGAIMVARFVVMPCVAFGVLLSGWRVGLIPYEKILWFVLLMQGCMPSAQNSVVILQMENRPDLAASMAKTLTAVYLLSAVPIALLLSAILLFVTKAEESNGQDIEKIFV